MAGVVAAPPFAAPSRAHVVGDCPVVKIEKFGVLGAKCFSVSIVQIVLCNNSLVQVLFCKKIITRVVRLLWAVVEPARCRRPRPRGPLLGRLLGRQSARGRASRGL
jgi:hypothetical protein